MPQESKSNKEFTYSKEEIQAILMKDLFDHNRISLPCQCKGITDVQVKIGDVPLGNLDSDPVYGFGGIKINVEY